MLTRIVFLCVAMISVGLSAGVLRADAMDDPGVVKKIVQDWQRRQQIRGFRYRIAGTEVVPKGRISATYPPGSLPGDVPPEDIVSKLTKEYFVDLERNRSRIETDYGIHDPEFRFVRYFEVDLHDGQDSQTFYPRDRNRARFDDPARGPWAADVEFRSDGPAFGRYDLPVLLAHGMVPMGERGSTLAPTGTLRRDLSVGEFTVSGRTVRDGRTCIVLRSQTDHTGRRPAFREFWVDVERGSTIVRYVRYIGDAESFQIDLWYDQDESPNYPLARFTYLQDHEGRRVQTHEMFVVEHELEPMLADSLFYVEPQPGLNVADRVTDRRYRVGATGEPDRDLAEMFFEQEQGHRSGTFRVVFLAMNVLVILISVSIFAHYHKMRKTGVNNERG